MLTCSILSGLPAAVATAALVCMASSMRTDRLRPQAPRGRCRSSRPERAQAASPADSDVEAPERDETSSGPALRLLHERGRSSARLRTSAQRPADRDPSETWEAERSAPGGPDPSEGRRK